MVSDRAVGLDGEDVVAHPVEEVPVVACDHHGAVPCVEVILKCVERVEVQVIRRLVKDEQVGRLHEDEQELKTSSLSAREISDRCLLFFSSELEEFQELRG